MAAVNRFSLGFHIWKNEHMMLFRFPSTSCQKFRGYKVHQVVKRETGESHEGPVHVFTPLHANRFNLRDVDQALYLTKSLQCSRPLVYEKENCMDPVIMKKMVEDFRLTLLHTRNFFADDQEHKRIVRREETKDVSSGVKTFYNINQIVAMNSHKWYPEFHQHCICFKVCIAANWKRSGVQNPVQVSIRDIHMIYRKQMLPLFWDTDVVDKMCAEELNWDYLTSPTFHILASNNIRLRTDTGFDKDIPYSCPNTLVLSEHNGKAIFNGLQKGIMMSFATARAHALTHGLVDKNGDLPSPIPIQCIVIGGKILKLISFQLNTINMETNNGVKNLVWFNDTKLFESGDLQDRKKRTLTKDLIGFEPDSIELLIKFLLNGA